jgi:hypothetical protein
MGIHLKLGQLARAVFFHFKLCLIDSKTATLFPTSSMIHPNNQIDNINSVIRKAFSNINQTMVCK